MITSLRTQIDLFCALNPDRRVDREMSCIVGSSPIKQERGIEIRG